MLKEKELKKVVKISEYQRSEINIDTNTQKMKNKIFVGIDFSLISPGICIIKNEQYKWISIYSTDIEDHHKILTKENSSFKILNESKSVTINLRNKTLKQGTTYSHTERNKIKSSIEEVDFLIQEVRKHLNDNDEVYVAIEGISFGASGNTLIDLAMSTGLLRSLIATKLLNSIDRFYVFSPGTIKKFAGKGTFKKNDMYDALISNSETEHLEFVKILNMYKDSWITPGGVVKKPLDDLVDATWIALLLKDVVEKGSDVESEKSSKKVSKKIKSPLNIKENNKI